MLNVVQIACTDFMSFKRVDLKLDQRCYVVKGNNYDNVGQQSNGSGKTSLVDVICVALLGQSLTDRDLKKCVNRASETSYFTVTVELSEDHAGDAQADAMGIEPSSILITRKIYANTRSQELSIAIDGQPVKDLMTKVGVECGVDLKAGNQWILDKLLGISKEDLLNYFLISERGYRGFLGSNNEQKMAVIARFSNAKLVDQAIANLKRQQQELVVSQQVQLGTLNSLDGEVRGLNYYLTDEAKQQFEQDKQSKIDDCLSNLKELECKLQDKQKQIAELQLSAMVRRPYDATHERGLQAQLKELQALERQITNQQTLLKNKLAGQIECPKCHHLFVLSAEPIAELEDQRVALNEEHETVNLELTSMVNELSSLELLKAFERESGELQTACEAITRQVERELNEIERLEQQQFEVDHIKVKLNDVNARRVVIDSTIAALMVSEQLVTVWLDRFERFKFYLINKPIATLCDLTNQVLRDINCEYSIEIEGFKQLKSGELRAELTPVVYTNGMSPQSYDQFSAGERVRLNLACDLAVQRLINNTSGGGLNFYASDELLNPLDATGMLNIARAFNFLGKTILLISHSGSEINYEHQLTVEKRHNESKVL